MSFNLVKNAGIGGLLLLLVATALWGFRSIGALVSTLTETVEVHKPSQVRLVQLNEKLGTSGEHLVGYLNRDRISAADVADALADLRRRFESAQDLAHTLGKDFVLDKRPSVSAHRAFLGHVDEVKSADEQSEPAREQLAQTSQQLALVGPALANFSAAVHMATAPPPR
jgi:hypothetical protein